jgi:hypothetical protein
MAGSYAKWYGDIFLKLLNDEMKRRIYACVIAIANRAKKLLSVPGTGGAIRPHSYWYGGGKRTVKKRGTVYGHAVSQPGEAPRKQTGRLRSSVAFEVNDTPAGPVGRAGTNVKYGRPLELGAAETRDKVYGKKTRPFVWRLLARPWLRRSLNEMLPFIRAVMSRPMKL